MTISLTNIFAYGDSGQSLSRMKDDELHKVRYNNDNGWVIGCFNACDGVSCGRISCGDKVWHLKNSRN